MTFEGIGIYLLNQAGSASLWLMEYSQENGGITAFALFLLWVGTLVSHAYFTTLPPRGIRVNRGVSEGTGISIKVVNNSGDHLKDSFVIIDEIKQRETYIHSLDMNMGGDLMLTWATPQSLKKVEIKNGRAVEMKIGFTFRSEGVKNPYVYKDKDNLIEYPKGKSETKFSFGANTLKGETKTLPFWVEVEWDGDKFKLGEISW